MASFLSWLFDLSFDVFFDEGDDGYSPRIAVRSIKEIRKGEEVTVAYTDLLQPKVYIIMIAYILYV